MKFYSAVLIFGSRSMVALNIQLRQCFARVKCFRLKKASFLNF